MRSDGANGVQAVGFYDDDLLRTDGGWQITRRHFTLVLMQEVTNTNPPRSV